MPKYKILMQYSDGTSEMEDDVFDIEEEAEKYGGYLVGCCRTGAETLNLSNPGDYPINDYEDPDFEVIEVDECKRH